jgi:hypothetical protein
MTLTHSQLRKDQLSRLQKAIKLARLKLARGQKIHELDDHLHPRCLTLSEFVVLDGKADLSTK